MPSCPRPTTEMADCQSFTQPSQSLSSAEQVLLTCSEELLLSNQWIEIKDDNTRVLTDEGRAEVTRRCQSDFSPQNE
jgi:hypothetical protein